MDKRGVMGLDVAKGFMLLLLVIGIIGFVLVIIASQLLSISNTTMPSKSLSYSNQSVSSVDVNGTVLSYGSAGKEEVKCTITACINQTSETAVPTNNWTEIGECRVAATAATNQDNYDQDWNCTYSITYVEPYAHTLLRNTSVGTSDFFDDSGTWLTLLSVVIIILIISVVILAVNRFGGGGIGSSGNGKFGRRASDSTEL